MPPFMFRRELTNRDMVTKVHLLELLVTCWELSSHLSKRVKKRLFYTPMGQLRLKGKTIESILPIFVHQKNTHIWCIIQSGKQKD